MKNLETNLLNQEDIPDLVEENLELIFFVASHGLLVFQCLSNKSAIYLCFSDVNFIDCPTKMNKATVTTNNIIKKSLIEKYFTEKKRSLVDKLSLFQIDCDEGKFFILTSNVWILQNIEINEIETYIVNSSVEPLWENGYSLKELVE